MIWQSVLTWQASDYDFSVPLLHGANRDEGAFFEDTGFNLNQSTLLSRWAEHWGAERDPGHGGPPRAHKTNLTLAEQQSQYCRIPSWNPQIRNPSSFITTSRKFVAQILDITKMLTYPFDSGMWRRWRGFTCLPSSRAPSTPPPSVRPWPTFRALKDKDKDNLHYFKALNDKATLHTKHSLIWTLCI